MPLILKNPEKVIGIADSSILQKGYLENPEIDCSNGDQYLRNIAMFNKFGIILNPYTRPMYEYIKNFCIDYAKNHPQYPKYIWKPKICDVALSTVILSPSGLPTPTNIPSSSSKSSFLLAV